MSGREQTLRISLKIIITTLQITWDGNMKEPKISGENTIETCMICTLRMGATRYLCTYSIVLTNVVAGGPIIGFRVLEA